MMNTIEHSENKYLLISKTRLDLDYSNPMLNRHAFRMNAKQLRQNQNILSCLNFVPFDILAIPMFDERWTGALQVQPRFRTIHTA